MTEIKDGAPAFPTDSDNYGPKYSGAGMTLRDYFAAKALPVATQWETESPTGNSKDPFPFFDGIAARAYCLADAMLRTLEAS